MRALWWRGGLWRKREGREVYIGVYKEGETCVETCVDH